MANASMTETEKLYASFWVARQEAGRVYPATPQMAIADSLMQLAEGMPRVLTEATYKLYTAALSPLTPSEIIRAFSRATDELRFFPAPSILREFGGLAADGDPIAREAKTELLHLLTGMRGAHGATLAPIPGKVLYGTEDDPKDEEGNRVVDAIRGKSTEFPIARRTQEALVRLGWGDSTRGLAVIADHPALGRRVESDDPQYRTNQLRTADEILKRFVEAYREV
jgi:hypothetical protein